MLFKWIIEKIYLSMKGNLVYYDSTTNSKSRYYYDNVAKEKYAKKKCCVIFVDIDGLKQVNDKLGHNCGTQLIKEVSRSLLEMAKVYDVCRTGGDEFVLFCDYNIDVSQLEKIEHISYGIYWKQQMENIITAIKGADERMYIMKKEKKETNNI